MPLGILTGKFQLDIEEQVSLSLKTFKPPWPAARLRQNKTPSGAVRVPVRG
jgi:hypothetical protein